MNFFKFAINALTCYPVLGLFVFSCSQYDGGLNAVGRLTNSKSTSDHNDESASNLASIDSAAGPHYKSPLLTDPIQVVIEKDGGAYPAWRMTYPKTTDKIKMLNGRQIEAPIGSPPRPENDVSEYYFPFNRDVLVTIKMPLILKEPIQIFGGRNVVIRGEGNENDFIVKPLTKGMPAKCDQTLEACKNKLNDYKPDMSAAFIIDSPRNSVVIENVRVKLSGDFTDAFVFRQNPATNPRPEGVDVFLRNVEAHEIGGAYPASRGHGDIVQLQSGMYRNLFFENIIGSTGYQGFYLPHRPKGSPTLCKIVSERKPNTLNDEDRWDVRICTPPMEVTGVAYFRNVVLRPLPPSLCVHCITPYIGLWTVDPSNINRKELTYKTILNNVTFYRDPRRPVEKYIVPSPAENTPEGEINMSIVNEGLIKGKLTVVTEK